MNRMVILSVLALFVFGSIAFAAPKPNIVLILGDEQAWSDPLMPVTNTVTAPWLPTARSWRENVRNHGRLSISTLIGSI